MPHARRDGGTAQEVLAEIGVSSDVCRNVHELCEEIERGAGAALIAEEQLTDEAVAKLHATLAKQPAWSDFPLLIIGSRRGSNSLAPQLFTSLGNVTLLDAPLRMRTLSHAAQSAIRSRRRQYTARGAIEQRDNFLAMLGHELRNPLSVISLAVELGNRDPNRAAAQMPILQRQVEHLSVLLDDLLDVARVSSGKIVLKTEPVPLDALVDRLDRGLRFRFDEAQLNLRTIVDPNARGHATVLGDPVRLEKVLINLLTNALKYTPAGGHVELSLALVDEMAELCVTDSGVGIDAKMLPHVFELFVQAETSLARAAGGMGVGLSLVQTLVKLHGGEVQAYSEGIGHGSSFRIRLPLAQTEAAVAWSPELATSDEQPASRAIVVVEDNEDSRELLVLALERAGHEVRSAPDGESGLALLLAERPHAAIVDIGLPGIDGYEVARRTRAAHGAGLLLIALTGYGQASDRMRAFDAGFDVHLTKPPGIERLCALLVMAPPQPV